MRVLITGARGQLGRELQRSADDATSVVALDLPELDITDASGVDSALREHCPQLIINAAAYTAVDRAEQEPELCHRVNVLGAEQLARAARQIDARLLQISTDYVFHGTCGAPYRPTADPEPISVYGKSKLEGERRVLDILGPRGLVVRSSWLYAAEGSNFVDTMLRLFKSEDTVRVVADQIGTPTWARDLARALWTLGATPAVSGIYHWTNAGVASWYDFAIAIAEEAVALGALADPPPIVPVTSAEFPRPAARPPYSVLDKSDCWALTGVAPHWRDALRRMLQELAPQARGHR